MATQEASSNQEVIEASVSTPARFTATAGDITVDALMVNHGDKWELVEAGWVVELDKQPPKPLPERSFPWSVPDVSAAHEIAHQIFKQGGLAHVEWAIRIKARKAGQNMTKRPLGNGWWDQAEDADRSPDDAAPGDSSAEAAVGRGSAIDPSGRRRTPTPCV